jgi:7-cyano-7-deazaguanine reductase
MTENLLGKTTQYPQQYNPEILLPIPRETNRKILGLTDSLPFSGEDIWQAYELSWLNQQGLPQVAMGRFSFSCDSSYLIESKSFKLYLNSLNQEKYESIEAVRELLVKDLSEKSGTDVYVELFNLHDDQPLSQPQGVCLDTLPVEINNYHPDANLLVKKSKQIEEQVYTNLFRSNCPITNQPDWASVSIHYQGTEISHESLLAYLVSYRQHNDYHENCVEKIFVDIQDKCQPELLTVQANFLRRGGLDINPIRSTQAGHEKAFPRFVRQ